LKSKGLCNEIEILAVRNIYLNKKKYIEMFKLLLNFIQLKSNKEFIEDWLNSIFFFKHLESLLIFNNSNNEEFSKLLEETKKNFDLNPENKKLKKESKKLNKYYLKFINFFRNKLNENENFKIDFCNMTNNENEKNLLINLDLNESKKQEKNNEFKGNTMNLPDFAYEKIKEFLNFCLFKKQEKINNNPFSNQFFNSLYSQPCKETLRLDVLENIFKNFKTYSNNENPWYMDNSLKIFDLNDLSMMQFHMFLFDLFIERILENDGFLDEITISNW